MKQCVYIIIMVVFLGSCTNDSLNVTPLNELSDVTFWETEDDAYLALIGSYDDWEGWANILMMDAMADNAYDQHFSWRIIQTGQFLPTSTFSNWYNSNAGTWFTYERIRKYNNFLEKVENVQMDETKKEQFKAEVRFLRAYDYFKKAMFYGDMTLVLETVPANSTLPRTPVAEIHQFILDELTDISNILPVQNNIQSGGRVTSGAALALKARLELFLGMYEEAMADSKRVIDMDYELYPDYRQLFLPGNRSDNKEAILAINYAKDFIPEPFIPQLLLTTGDGGWSSLTPTKSLVDEYESLDGHPIDDPESSYDPEQPFENRDLRLGMTVKYPGQEWNGRIFNTLDRLLPDGSTNLDYYKLIDSPRGGMAMKKYVGTIPPSENQVYDVNIMVIRLAEMYLTYAEAAVELGQNMDTARQLINQLRERGGLPPAEQLTRDLVRRERRVELALEGLRYFDIKRWDIGATTLNGPIYGSRLGSIDYNTGEVTWSEDYIKLNEMNFSPTRNYLLPIPQSELDVSDWQQNPGY